MNLKLLEVYNFVIKTNSISYCYHFIIITEVIKIMTDTYILLKAGVAIASIQKL